MTERTERRSGQILTTVLAGVAGGLVVVMVTGASLALLIPAGLGVGLVSFLVTGREHAHDEQRA